MVSAIVCTVLTSGATGATADSTKCRTPTPALLAAENGPENCAAYGASGRATQNAAGMTCRMLSAGMAVRFGLRLCRWCIDQQPRSKNQSKNPYSDLRFSHLSCLLFPETIYTVQYAGRVSEVVVSAVPLDRRHR